MNTETILDLAFWKKVQESFESTITLRHDENRTRRLSYCRLCCASDEFYTIWQDDLIRLHIVNLGMEFITSIKGLFTAAVGSMNYGSPNQQSLFVEINDNDDIQREIRLRFIEWNIKRLEKDGCS